MMPKTRHCRKQIRNTWKELKYGAWEGWSRKPAGTDTEWDSAVCGLYWWQQFRLRGENVNTVKNTETSWVASKESDIRILKCIWPISLVTSFLSSTLPPVIWLTHRTPSTRPVAPRLLPVYCPGSWFIFCPCNIAYFCTIHVLCADRAMFPG